MPLNGALYIQQSTLIKARVAEKKSKPLWRKCLRGAFILWAFVSTGLLVNSYRTRDVDPGLLLSNAFVVVSSDEARIQFSPASPKQSGLIFLSGGGVAAEAYAPLLRPIADAEYPVFVIRLPFRIAPLESHKLEAIGRVHQVIADNPEITQWVLSGHSLGAALACRIAREKRESISALVLVGTTHPKSFSLASLSYPVTKIYGSQDGVASPEEVHENQKLLPKQTRWILIEGANHSQFGNYGNQLFDGTATISRNHQQDRTRIVLLDALGSEVNDV
jgi:pimeloyl-ACP methyl ester carboxylesterase